MSIFKNQSGTSDIIMVSIILGIIGAVFITGVFVWQEYNGSKVPQIIIVEKKVEVYKDFEGVIVEEKEIREEVDKSKLIGNEELDCKISGGNWVHSFPPCGTPKTCEGMYDYDKNPYWAMCQVYTDEKDKIDFCDCGGAGFCWDGESCIDFQNYKDEKNGEDVAVVEEEIKAKYTSTGNDASVKAHLAALPAGAEIYYDEEGSYLDFCSYDRILGIEEGIKRMQGEDGYICVDGYYFWKAYGQLSEGYFCVDSTNKMLNVEEVSKLTTCD